MPRPLMQHGVGQLEEMFTKRNYDPNVLKQLENELQYRQVPRAVALLAEVQAAMYGVSLAEPPVAAPSPSATKQMIPPVKPPEPAIEPFDLLPAPPPIMAQPRPPSVASESRKPPRPPSLAIPVDDAYKVLKATPASPWESIEQTRNLLVLQAHPSRVASLSTEKRAQAQTEAAGVNAAYLRLSAVRCSR